MAIHDSNALARLRLSLMPGLGPIRQQGLVAHFGSAGAAFAAVGHGVDDALLERTLRWLDTAGHHLLCYEDSRYPALLREIADPPGVIFAIGDLSCLGRSTVGIVGARNATPQGARDAYAIARALSEAGLCIASGLALGIDAAAHRGGLDGRGSSVAVMGTGPDLFYPRRNRELAQRLAAHGCILTEFPLGTAPARGNFPRRNRLISGLARGVLVVEANEGSGSLITAEFAAEQNRDVLAMPGSIHSPLSKGCHKLIREGATLVENVNDVLEALGLPPCGAHPAERARDIAGDPLLDALGGAPASADQIALRTGLAAAQIAAQLALLQIEGFVEEVAGGKFQRVGGAH